MPLPSIPGLQIIVSFLIEFIISSTQVYSLISSSLSLFMIYWLMYILSSSVIKPYHNKHFMSLFYKRRIVTDEIVDEAITNNPFIGVCIYM